MDLHLIDEQVGLLLALALIAATPIAANAQTIEPLNSGRVRRAIFSGLT